MKEHRPERCEPLATINVRNESIKTLHGVHCCHHH